mmetsp:Transcript_24654/g.59331  ORF Transcript_24654/g.59331 Transcript_24654/m.59331 type:complete len:93 (+) Transcript_24654:242-520(+)
MYTTVRLSCKIGLKRGLSQYHSGEKRRLHFDDTYGRKTSGNILKINLLIYHDIIYPVFDAARLGTEVESLALHCLCIVYFFRACPSSTTSSV